jgi:hypothetical protein
MRETKNQFEYFSKVKGFLIVGLRSHEIDGNS